ncbi:hypothetical protein G6O69_17675 [Pseudenhygromyxa sp. WMMC2535]|uniref:hypothetical protein n=1 Tax=Pseudenhygromyxa sp. WMMC2535 TaxID=2712867 RepID=UPI001554095D|nr:hypothetical protein [Pseudenhygromyxa sp. WMMC2535]NVB39677.1 hypothetical protein [Pseudenhygromyxa sp. WMMC2535]
MIRRAAPLCLLASLACSSSPGSDTGSTSTTEDEGTTAEGGSEASTSDASDAETETETDSETNSDTGTAGETETETGSLGECPEISSGEVAGTVTLAELDEASGMVRSRSQELLWVHNDSGDLARLFALDLGGELVAELRLEGAGALDWEDLAIGPGPEPGDYLYAGDIGDNGEARPYITIYRLPEPADVASLGDDPLLVADWDALELTYPDGSHNAETLLVDPVSGDLFIVTKGEETGLYRLAAPLAAGELEKLADPNYPSALATGGEISPQGDFVAVRGYIDAFLWPRADGQTIGEAMLAEPCEIPVASEPQGETLAIDADSMGYFTLSEGTGQPLWRFESSSRLVWDRRPGA